MAEKDTKTNVTLADFVGKIVKDPKSPPDTILLTGYLGKSSEEGHTRLYFDPELKTYVEIPNDAILHSQQIPQEQSGLGGSNVWIASDAEVIHGKVGPSRTKAKFFQGPIGAAAAAAGGGGVAGPGGGAGNSVLPACVVTDASVCVCPGTILAGDCPTVIQCPPPTLQWTQCVTPLHGCPPPTQITQCPTPLHGCPTPPALCIPTHVFTQCHTPLHGCATQHVGICRTPVALCLDTAVQCKFATAAETFCPTNNPAACQLTPVCPNTVNFVNCVPHVTQIPAMCPVASGGGPGCPVGFPGQGGDPAGAAHVAAFGGQAAHAATLFCPSHPAVCQPSPFCPSPHHICPSNPVICPSPFCPSPHHICPSNPVICHPSPFCPSPFCPSPFCPSPACPSIHVGCPQSPFCPVSAGCPFNPGGGGGPQI
jgi:hypothetical protein